MHGVLGDVGLCDENGYFFIVDRIKELIKVKGFQVKLYFLTKTCMWEAHIEFMCLYNYDAVISCAVPLLPCSVK